MRYARLGLIALACALAPRLALAQLASAPGSAAGTDEESRSLRKRFGAGMAERLLRSTEDDDERLRGIARASADGSAESLGLLTGLQDSSLRSDPREMIELARGLAPYLDQEGVRARLIALVSMPNGGGVRREDVSPEELMQRIELARHTAALAIAGSHEAKAIDDLVKVARGGGPGQLAAANALLAFGVSPFSSKLDTLAPTSPVAAWLYAESGDLRLLDLLLATADGHGDAKVRAAALRGLAQAGDQRAGEIAARTLGLDAKKSVPDASPELRVAAAQALGLLDLPMRYNAVAALLADSSTRVEGVALAEHVQGAEIVDVNRDKKVTDPVRLLTSLLDATRADRAMRESILVALGRGSTAEAMRVLSLAAEGDPKTGLAPEPAAAQAIARSPSPAAMAAIERLSDKRLAARAYLLRRLVRGERSDVMEAELDRLAASKEPRDRAIATFAAVLFDRSRLTAALADAEPRVRRAAAMAARSHASAEVDRELLVALAKEKDEPTKVVLSGALGGGDPGALVPSLTLVDRAHSGSPEAPLAALALAARARLEDESLRDKVLELLSSRDPLTRAHVASGLALSPARDAIGQLATAYRYETDAHVRRAIVLAAATREADRDAPSRVWLLATAARLDPDALVRLVAGRVLANLPPNPAPVVRECAWLRVTATQGGALPSDLVGAYVGSDGLVTPIVFDDDGFALVPTASPGEGRLVLAPRVP